MTMSQLLEHYRTVLREVAEAAVNCGRDPQSVRVLAVSKTFPADDIAELYAAGCRAFGESRIPELQAKAAVLPGDIRWHLIGQLQANKARKAVRTASMIHSVDSMTLLERLERIAGEEGRHPGFLLEVNISGEAGKSGCTPEELPELAQRAAACCNMDWQGFMTMAPEGAEEETLMRIFGTLRRMRDEQSVRFNRPLPELSMGMSGDWQAAVRQGATIVRIGSAIFGHREYPAPAGSCR